MPTVAAFVDDLMFLSRIREAAKGAGVVVRAARTLEQLRAAAAQSSLVLMDLDSPRLPTGEALAALRSDPALTGVAVVAFFSHVHVERAEAARQAGASRVLARSAFVQTLPALLAELARPGARAAER